MIFLIIITFIFLIISISNFVYIKYMQQKNSIMLEKKTKENPNICILIPARDESQVIEDLLNSIECQTKKVPSENIYVIVESESDKTVEIANKHQMNYFVRKKLHLKSKGYALQELIEDLEKKKKYYDCYFIFDADNILEPNFIEKMLEDYHQGYTISTGYRAIKNTEHYFPVSAGLTFLMINDLRNKASMKTNGNLILSGTGYYIHGRLIKEWGTFPFHSLTEDYESSLYYTLHGISTHYMEDAIFYDEQPTNYKQSIRQRSRWIKGYFMNWFLYRKKLRKKEKESPHNLGSIIEMKIGIIPIVNLVIAIIFGVIALLWNMIIQKSVKEGLYLLLFLLFLYLALVILSFFLLRFLKRKNEIKKDVFLKSMFYHPIFLISYIHAFVLSWNKKLGWEKIEHNKRKEN